MKEQTQILQSIPVDKLTGSISVPIFQTTTFVHDYPGQHKGYDYTRSGNPTREVLEKLIAQLEQGAVGAAFASGMAAIDAVLRLLHAGDHVIAGNDIYGGTYRLLTTLAKRAGIETTFVNLHDPDAIEKAIQKNTKLVWVESPTNPLLRIIDINAVAQITQPRQIILAVDNTFASPVGQKPLTLGADVVVHSATKYIGGHSDVISGLVVTKTEELGKEILFIQNASGGVLSPFESWLLIRGLETLELRVKQHSENAQAVATYLQSHHAIKEVYYPGLKSHPHHHLAKKQQKYFSGVVSFRLHSDDEKISGKVVTSTKLFKLAESLGGIKSLINHPATMTHASIPKEQHHYFGISDGLIRLSVGLEDAQDLIEDLEAALDLIHEEVEFADIADLV
ncbi:MAG: trans-sulfuration enzyme family protein [Cyclobacteriaceae bacterium]|jgi:cystathionine gamma-lyase/homocysteine desulfhydrase